MAGAPKMQVQWIPSSGDNLYAEVWMPKRAKALVVLVHGLGSDTTGFGNLPAKLVDSGFAVVNFDQRGFGKSEGSVGWSDPNRCAQDIQAVVSTVRVGKFTHKPLYIVGHSLGATYTVAAHQQLAANAYVLAHPPATPMENRSLPRRVLFWAVRTRNDRKLAKGKPGMIRTTAPKPKRNARSKELQQELRQTYKRRQLAVQTLSSLHGFSCLDAARSLHAPTLVIASDYDRNIRKPATLEVRSALPNATLMTHEGGHSCFRDLDHERVEQAICQFLLAQL